MRGGPAALCSAQTAEKSRKAAPRDSIAWGAGSFRQVAHASMAQFGAWIGQNVVFCSLRRRIFAVCFFCPAQEGNAMFTCTLPRHAAPLRAQP
jgi:hypothetical protein